MEALRIIREDHRNLWRIASTIDIVADEIEYGSKIDPAFFTSIFDYIEYFMDGCHHAKEDSHLFPVLRTRNEEAGATLDILQEEHRNGPEMLRSLRQQLADTTLGKVPDADFVAALHEYTRSLKNHIRTEEKEVLPSARSFLLAEDWAEIDRAFLDNEDPMFGEKANMELRELYHRIASLAPESIGLGAHSAGELQHGARRTSSDNLLSVKGIESCYGQIKALKGIDLTVRRGELVALVGANGAGKTTFMRTLSGVQPITSGSIYFDREDITGFRSDIRMRKGICQSPEGRQVFGPLSIEDNLRLGAYTQPIGQLNEDLDKIYSMFPVLKEKRHLPSGTLSGGQQQMLAIGRALMGRPKLLLLDEPSMGLAPILVEEVFNVIKTLKKAGMTILLVEQNAFAALAIADRGYVMETGNITLTGSGNDLINNEEVRAAYLGM